MKKILSICAVSIMVLLTSCIKNDIPTFSEAQIEWDAAAWNANTSPRTYPVMLRVPIYGFATPTSAPAIGRASGKINLRVNVVGAQAPAERSFTYRVVPDETTAVAGTHFRAVTGTGTIPANSSFGMVEFEVLNPGVAGTAPVIVVLELTSTDALKPAVNYAKLGLSIAQN